ncbi:MAG TPA: ABC transporter permease [Bacteroidales bacterium]|nr:ABC transporter permease [Bacteroidales bacterium]HRZ77110.1 ABC transporter permease [Bacteroidales bacterium]
MRTILIIIRKEFIQIFRNRTMLPIIFLVPLIQLIILVNAATLEMKHIDLLIVDRDLSSSSRFLGSKFKGSPFFRMLEGDQGPGSVTSLLLSDRADVILVIPPGFEREFIRGLQSGQSDPSARVQLRVNAINATAAGLSEAYARQILRQAGSELMATMAPGASLMPGIRITPAFWYNPELNYKVFMVPGILVILVTIMGMFLSALNLVREKEIGTIEQINVTPIRKYQFIVGKLVPFWLIALFELGFGLFLGWLLFRIPLEGSLWLLFAFAGTYLIAVMGIGLFISAISSNQQQVMFISFFFMLTFILMSGIFTPTESMPDIAQYLNVINPFSYFMRVIRMVLLKGSQFGDISREFIAIAVYGMVATGLAVWRYRKTA